MDKIIQIRNIGKGYSIGYLEKRGLMLKRSHIHQNIQLAEYYLLRIFDTKHSVKSGATIRWNIWVNFFGKCDYNH